MKLAPTLILIATLLLNSFCTNGQSQSKDLNLIAESMGISKQNKLQTPTNPKKLSFTKKLTRYNPLSLLANGMLTAYQKVVSPQIGANCLYEKTCSHFSRQAIEEFGAVKGAFLSADRMSRCNRISAVTMWPSWYNAFGKIIEEPRFYSVKWYNQQPIYAKPNSVE